MAAPNSSPINLCRLALVHNMQAAKNDHWNTSFDKVQETQPLNYFHKGIKRELWLPSTRFWTPTADSNLYTLHHETTATSIEDHCPNNKSSVNHLWV